MFVSGEDAVSSRATTSAVYTLLLPYFLPLVAAVAPAIYLAIRCVRGDIQQAISTISTISTLPLD